MNNFPFYYISPPDFLHIKKTDYLDDLVVMLFEGTAEFINDDQRKELQLEDDYLSLVKEKVSSFKYRVPMFDISSNRIFLIFYENVYQRFFYDNYRFIDQHFYDDLISLSHPSDIEKNNIRILSHYEITTLEKTYYQVFYESFVLNNYITTCQRPSYFSGMEHITPYYSINELYYLAYDWNLSKNKVLSSKEIRSLCKKITEYDIPAETLLDHQLYIYDHKAFGLVKHYSLYGSYYMNIYLRTFRCCLEEAKVSEKLFKNKDLENQIKLMIKLIIHAPPFIKAHTVYRFIIKDDFLRHLRIGDIYQDPSFMSTTRNPFYYQENYSFGYILMKIKLPENIKGIALSIEAYSNFPAEEEIILPPTSKLKLLNIIEQSKEERYLIEKQIIRKYEFLWVGNDFLDKKEIKLNTGNIQEPDIQNVNFLNLINDENFYYISISDRLRYFRSTFVNSNNQFLSTIAGKTLIFNIESYDSSSVYKPFFYYEVTDGIMITSSNPRYGNINLLLELGPEIHVNYYFKYSVTDSSELLDLNKIEWIQWFSALAYVIGSRRVIFHSNYVLKFNKNDTIEEKQMKTRYTYSQNIYEYLKNKTKAFDNIIGLAPNFDYSRLDQLFDIPITDIIRSTDKDELFQIYQSVSIPNVGDFYLYIVENKPKLLNLLESKIELIYPSELNPFKNISYTLDSWMFLYNQNQIKQIPQEKEFIPKKGSFKQLIGDKKIPKFKNRLRGFLNQ